MPTEVSGILALLRQLWDRLTFALRDQHQVLKANRLVEPATMNGVGSTVGSPFLKMNPSDEPTRARECEVEGCVGRTTWLAKTSSDALVAASRPGSPRLVKRRRDMSGKSTT
nr:hypothetical protein [Archangium sp.]